MGDQISGWVCVDELKGHTAGFRFFSGSSGSNQITKRPEPEPEQPQIIVLDQATIDYRDYWYSKVLESLTLKPEHLEVLLSRGYTLNHVIQHGFKSATANQELSFECPNLPGVRDGKIIISGNGIVYPVRGKDGKINAIYYKDQDTQTRGKYKPWSTPGAGSCHISDEIPLNILLTEKTKLEGCSERIFFVEGFGLKDSLSHFKHNIDVLSASGGHFTASPNHLRISLDAIAHKEKTEIVLCPDGGDVTSKQGSKRWIKIFNHLKELGLNVVIGWWGQYEKKVHPDVDELENLLEVQCITGEEFEALAKHEISLQESEKKNQDKQKKFDNHKQHWKKKREFSPEIIDTQQLVSTPDDLQKGGAIIAVKSPMGTGKTIEVVRLLARNEKGAFITGYRNTLLHQTIGRIVKSGIKNVHHISDDGAKPMISDDFSIHGLCLNSIEHIDGYSKGRDVYLDEICSVLRYAVEGSTFKKDHAKILAIFKKVLQESRNVYIFDANLSDRFADFIGTLCPNKRLIKIENKYQPEPHILTFVEAIDPNDEIKKVDKSPMIKKLLEPDCTPFIISDSKRHAEVINEMLTAQGKQGILLDSNTTNEAWAKQFLKDPDEYILTHKPAFFIGTPSCESGLNITLKDYFTTKFSFFCGVLGTDAQMQMLFRLRTNLPHYISCPETSILQSVDNKLSDYSTKASQDESRKRIQDSVGRTAIADPVEALSKAMRREDGDWVRLSFDLGDDQSFEQEFLRWCLMEVLEDAGHKVVVEQMQINDAINEAVKQARKLLDRRKAEELFNATPGDIEWANQAAKCSPGKNVQRDIELTRLIDRLPGINEKPIWSVEYLLNCYVTDKYFINKQVKFWLLNNVDTSTKLHTRSWEYLLSSEFFYSPDHVKMRHDVIWALNELGVLKLFGTEYHKNSPYIVEIVNLLRSRKDIQRALKLALPPPTVDGKERLEIISSLLDQVGLANVFSRRGKADDGVKRRFYKCLPEGSVIDEAGLKKLAEAEAKPFDLALARECTLQCIEEKILKDMLKQDELEKPREPEFDETLVLFGEGVQDASAEWEKLRNELGRCHTNSNEIYLPYDYPKLDVNLVKEWACKKIAPILDRFAQYFDIESDIEALEKFIGRFARLACGTNGIAAIAKDCFREMMGYDEYQIVGSEL